MYRPGYGVVTTVVTVVCVLAVFKLLLAPHIPPSAENHVMAAARDDFLRQAQYEDVHWIPFGTQTFYKARTSNCPILLLIGSPTCGVVHTLDERTFADSEVSSYLNRSFVCARIDGAVYPEWMNAMRPMSRLRDPFWPDVQMWALDKEGRPYDAILLQPGDEDFSPTSYLPRFIELRQEFDATGAPGFPSAYVVQHQDARSLTQPSVPGLSVGPPSPGISRAEVSHYFGLYSAVLRSIGERSEIGFPVRNWVGLTPQVWRYLVMSGDREAFEGSVVGGILRSPMVDLLDGGFFHAETVGAGGVVDFDKLTVENADAMLALAEFAAETHEPVAGKMGRNVWTYLERSFRGAAGFIEGQQGRVGYRLRSPRYSVSARRFRESVPSALQDWAQANLGLDVVRYPQAVPFLASDVLDDPRTAEVMSSLRKTAAVKPIPVDANLTDVSLSCIARSIQVARIWGDPARMAEALDWLEGKEQLRVDGDVMRRLNGRRGEFGYLGDYLAYADVQLQAFLATGDPDAIARGLAVLRRMRELFAAKTPGVWVLSRPHEVMSIPDVIVPEIADNLHESCTARVIRLLMAYGRLLRSTDEGRADLARAEETVEAMRPIAAGGGPQSAGFFCAAAEVFDPAYAVAVGPDAVELANALAAAVPTRLVAPAVGPVRPDLQSRPAGIYIVRDQVVGPLTVAAAAQRLSPIYTLAPSPARRAIRRPHQP